MAVRVTIGSQEQPKEPKGFPKLMKSKSSGLIVFFEKRKSGQVLIGDEVRDSGFIAHDWYMPNFEEFTEPITIQTV